MLILQRKKGQSVVLDGNIKVTITDISTDGVKLAIDAPKEVTILREELVEAAAANREAAAGGDKIEKLKGIKNML